MAMAAGEVKTQRIHTRYDLSDVINLALDITRPDGSVVKVTSGITVGTVDVTTDEGNVLKANEYVLWTNSAGDFPEGGDYQAKLSADFGATKQLKSFYKTIEVEA